MLKKILAVLLTTFAFSTFAAVDANDASLADLDSIKGIGPGTSAKIMEQRKAAKFKDWGDFIERVPGIGEKRAAKLAAEGLTVNGQGFKAAATAPTDKAKTAAATATKAVEKPIKP